MMKIVKAVNSMLANAGQITQVVQTDGEYFFLYRDKYKWSVMVNEEQQYILSLYPYAPQPITQLAELTPDEWCDMPHVLTYRAADIKTRDATEAFMELYLTVSAVALNADAILDEIIRGE